MSYKKFSASNATPGNDKPADKTKIDPAAQPAKKQDEAAPAQKS